MPFLTPSISGHLKSIGNFKIIPWIDLQRYRADFRNRVIRLKDNNGIDHLSDLRAIELDIEAFNQLIQNAANGDYLVAQYYCDSERNKDKNLNVALCIKRRIAGSDDKIIDNKVIDSFGTTMEEDFFKDITRFYLGRRDRIKATLNREFDFDKEGRAHLIDDDLKEIVRLLHKSGNNLFLYFILDDKLDNKKTLSVVFADQKIKFKEFFFGDPVAYDHGTACCPIKP